MLGVHSLPLGVTQYGQSGTPAELYREFGIDSDAIAAACFAALQ
jgi:pyruvate dehydrogenase complex dehydrogenase (E1) component